MPPSLYKKHIPYSCTAWLLCWSLSSRPPPHPQCQDALLCQSRLRLVFSPMFGSGKHSPTSARCLTYVQRPKRQVKCVQCHCHHSSRDHDVFLGATATTGIDSDAVACGLATFHRSDSAHDRLLIARSGHARHTLRLLKICFARACCNYLTSRNTLRTQDSKIADARAQARSAVGSVIPAYRATVVVPTGTSSFGFSPPHGALHVSQGAENRARGEQIQRSE